MPEIGQLHLHFEVAFCCHWRAGLQKTADAGHMFAERLSGRALLKRSHREWIPKKGNQTKKGATHSGHQSPFHQEILGVCAQKHRRDHYRVQKTEAHRVTQPSQSVLTRDNACQRANPLSRLSNANSAIRNRAHRRGFDRHMDNRRQKAGTRAQSPH
jgi:hypothetical protein